MSQYVNCNVPRAFWFRNGRTRNKLFSIIYYLLLIIIMWQADELRFESTLDDNINNVYWLSSTASHCHSSFNYLNLCMFNNYDVDHLKKSCKNFRILQSSWKQCPAANIFCPTSAFVWEKNPPICVLLLLSSPFWLNTWFDVWLLFSYCLFWQSEHLSNN